jgi:hypothetical protein
MSSLTAGPVQPGGRVLAALLAALVLGVAAACNGVTSGVVIEKNYDDPDRWTSSEPVYKQNCRTVRQRTTSYQDCTRVLSHYEQEDHYDGPHWSLRLRDREGRTGWVEVDQIAYHRARIGDTYPEGVER